MLLLKVIFKGIFLVQLLIGNVVSLQGQDPPPKQYQVKAVFLYNFTQFVEWPPTVFADDNAPLVLGILGEDPFGTYLQEVINGEQSNGHPLSIRRIANGEEIEECHVLFINLPDPDQIAQTLVNLHGKHILTVSDQGGFLEAGGMIQFKSVNNKVQFQINPEAASAADLKISSKLLRVAEVITLPNE